MYLFIYSTWFFTDWYYIFYVMLILKISEYDSYTQKFGYIYELLIQLVMNREYVGRLKYTRTFFFQCRCGETVTKREQFNDLSIDFPRRKKLHPSRSIQDSLDLFFRVCNIQGFLISFNISLINRSSPLISPSKCLNTSCYPFFSSCKAKDECIDLHGFPISSK